MPARGRRGRAAGKTSRGRGSSRARRDNRQAPEDVATVPYREMLAEEGPVLEPVEPDRPLKRRKTARDVHSTHADVRASSTHSASSDESKSQSPSVTSSPISTPLNPPFNVPSPGVHDEDSRSERSLGANNLQTVYDDTDSSKEESDAEYERMILEGIKDDQDTADKQEAEEAIQVSVSVRTPTSRPPRNTPRRHARAQDKIQRIDFHKVSLLCWLMHGYCRSAWCNHMPVRTFLRQVLTPRQASFLKPSSSLPQHEQSLLFQRGLEEASKAFREEYTVTRTEATTRKAFTEAAGKLRGSSHTGNQLFCALLRAAGVDARLVCSLQVTKLTSIVPVSEIDSKGTGSPVPEAQSSWGLTGAESDTDGARPVDGTARPIKRRLGQRLNNIDEKKEVGSVPTPSKRSLQSTFASPYPVYWVEAFSISNQRWLCIDPLVTKTWNKPRKLEPPLYDEENTMTYVMAFDSDLSVRDVTRRYTKSYNAKTYKRRIESTVGGEKWLKRVMRLFRRHTEQDVDQIEDAELARYEASEPMPNAQQDFKEHPVYALERHLHHNEVIHPKREVGKVVIGKKQEPIYRRRDVHIVRSSDKWYRALGRQIRPSEQPLKYGKPRRRRRQSLGSDHDDEEVGVGLYAEFQTQLFVPNPITDGEIQKNIYGNLDIYVPSMIPAGGVHVRCSDAVQAARLARVDFAEAVTGFQFKGRKGTAITRGVIVAKEYCEAIENICHGLREARADAAAVKASTEALMMWKKFLLGLRIRERIMQDAETDAKEEDIQQRIDDAEDEEVEIAGEGGFFVEHDPQPAPTSIAEGKGKMVVTPASETLDEAIEAMNRDEGFSTFRTGRPAKREYFEPTLYSPWDLPDEKPTKVKDTLVEHHAPSLATEFTKDSLFDEEPEDLQGVDLHDADSIASPIKSDADEADNELPPDAGGGFLPASPKLQHEDGPDNESETVAEEAVQHTTEPKHSSILAELPHMTKNDENLPDAQHESNETETPTSLLSHDPEDDEMDEGWLVEETGI
ncbi:hypothetical protein FH972_023240 [Carpinus fangiana]|uniref:Rad4 beta-hairpin domain-containing protein n=1 Tax=Carpinus fangiana TaxID=176857 RepID=A0A5N6KWW5_9ROSI|nr:hypothetical protein FH972_023240 [Carpinus fangiana]